MLKKLINSRTFFVLGLFLIIFASLLAAFQHQGAALNLMMISFASLVLGTITYFIGLSR